MNIKKIYFEFSEKYPDYVKHVEYYKEGPDHSLEFKMDDGKTAWYYPVIGEYKKKHK